MQINRIKEILGQLMNKQPEQRGFSQAGLTNDQCNRALLLKEFEPCHGLFDPRISLYPVDGRFFRKRMFG
jgi:hypothetical protein